MSCSIEESTTSLLNEANALTNQLNNQQQQQQANNTTPLINNSLVTNSLNSFTNPTNNNNTSSMTATDPSSKPNLMSMINTVGNQNTTNGNSQKVVQAGLGNQLIITTVFQGGSPQKVVTVSSTSNNSTNSSVASLSASSSASSSSSVGSTSPQASSQANLGNIMQSSAPILQAAINGVPQAGASNIASASGNGQNGESVSPPDSIRQTITLTDDNNGQGNNNNNTSGQNMGYPIQQ